MLPAAASASLVGTIPVVVTSGVVLHVTKAAFPRHSGRIGPARGRSRSKKRTRRSGQSFFGGSSPF